MVIIADDITGAAEIAGVASEQGFPVQLLCAGGDAVGCDVVATSGVTVIATDTRSMSEDEAVAETRRIASSFLISHSSFLIFKKTDSALRGHVVAELKALMAATGYERAVYLPANPSKGRIIRQGVYYIKEVREVPIAETAFSYDPEFPATTSVLEERFPDARKNGIVMPDAESEEDIRSVVAQYNDGKTLFAGAADLFYAVLQTHLRPLHDREGSEYPQDKKASMLILCGSTQSKPLDLGIPIAPMPREVYDGSNDIDLWDCQVYDTVHSLILTMPFTHRTGKEAATHLRMVMARKVKALVGRHRPQSLIIEGGATAWATLQMLGWQQFDEVRQIAPGVVQMRASCGTLVTLKPGSYPWGGLF